MLPRPAARRPRHDVEFGAVLAVLLATGWVANHFVALMPAISDRQHLSTATLDAIFGIYAVGLLPGLLLGGRASDAFGRRAVVLTGSATAAVGTVLMLLSQQPEALTGRPVDRRTRCGAGDELGHRVGVGPQGAGRCGDRAAR